MPDFLAHLAYGNCVFEALAKRGCSLDKNAFLFGCLLPDFVEGRKDVTHFKIHQEGRYRLPCVACFVDKNVSKIVSSDVLKGALCHLYLDRAFFSEYLIDNYEYCDDVIKNRISGYAVPGGYRAWIVELHDAYTSINELLEEEYHISLDDLPKEVDYPEVYELPKPFVDVTYEIKMITGFRSEYTGKFLDYNSYSEFLRKKVKPFIEKYEWVF